MNNTTCNFMHSFIIPSKRSVFVKQLLFIVLINLFFIKGFTQTSFQTLNYLYSISGTKCVSGIHNREPNSDPAQQTNAIYNVVGKYPAFWSGDFLFQAENINNRGVMIAEAKREWGLGSIVHLMWHACSPAKSEPCSWDANGVLSKMTDAEWTDLITDGTAINQKWKSMMDEVAVYLQDLKDNKVEVLFRPLHEMNQGSFWWGGRSGENGTAKLYQITHDYLKNAKGLTNIIWEWDLQDFSTLSSDLTTYNPGDAYWDVLALDMYNSDGTGYTTAKYNAIVKAGNGKPIAIGECQVLPSASEIYAQPKWTYFMSWAELTFSNNTDAQIQALYGYSKIVTLDEMPGWTVTDVKNLTSESHFDCHPNPVDKILYVSTALKYDKLLIVNAVGRQVLSFLSPNGSVDVSQLDPGLYNVLLINKNGGLVKSVKMIKS